MNQEERGDRPAKYEGLGERRDQGERIKRKKEDLNKIKNRIYNEV